MANEILDYFAGMSSRKLEPLDKSEMFEELLNSEKEIESVEEPVKEEQDQQDLESPQDPLETSSEANDESVVQASDEENDANDEETEEEIASADAHWDDLAAELGLDPAPETPARRPSGPARQPARSEAKPSGKKGSRKQRKAPTGAERARPEKTSPDRKDSQATGKKDDSDRPAPEQAPDRSTSTSRGLAEETDDLFAAFSGARKEPARAEAVEVDVEPVPEQSELEPDEDFIEFEVHDLGGQPDESKESDRRRRRRPDRSDRGSRGRKKDDDADQSKERETRTTKGRRRDSQDEVDNEVEESRPSRSRTRSRAERHEESPRDKQSADNDAESRDGDSGKKKPKIPTWDDAITAVVEKNIKRHKSSSQRGRRRRN